MAAWDNFSGGLEVAVTDSSIEFVGLVALCAFPLSLCGHSLHHAVLSKHKSMYTLCNACVGMGAGIKHLSSILEGQIHFYFVLFSFV